MKKFISIALALLVFLTVIPAVVKAEPIVNPIFATIEEVEQMIADALAPVWEELASLAERVTALEQLGGGGGGVEDFDLPSPENWIVTAITYEWEGARHGSVTILTEYDPSHPEKTCSWQGDPIGYNQSALEPYAVYARAIAYWPDGVTPLGYAVGTCGHISFELFTFEEEFPKHGDPISFDIYLWWMGKEKKYDLTAFWQEP